MRQTWFVMGALVSVACSTSGGTHVAPDAADSNGSSGEGDAAANAPDQAGTVNTDASAAPDANVGDPDGSVRGPDVAADTKIFVDAPGDVAAASRVSVLQHHNHASRDGVYVDPALTKAALAHLHVDTRFPGASIAGPTYAQPLYLAAAAAGGRDLVIVATEQNHVYAFDAAAGGKAIWDQPLGMPLPKSRLATLRAGCGNIDPLGVTGTPIIDAATRTIYVDAMLIADANATAQHQVFALDADSGAIKPGWPVDLNSTAAAGGTTFESLVQNQRGALALLGGQVFVPFGGHIGDCSTYHGWIVGISTTNPKQVSAWVTRALAGGVWAPGGIASDGQSLFFATGNTETRANNFTAPASWLDGETIFRLPPSLAFSGQNADYFTPSNWAALDNSDADIGGTAPIVLDLAGATPSALVVGLGKDGNAYLVNRTSMGGISNPVSLARVSTGAIINAAAAYTTPTATYVVFRAPGQGCPAGQSGGLTAIKITATNPPAISTAWCAGPSSNGSPAVSASDDKGSDAVVWIVGSNNKLYGYAGDTGEPVFAGGTTTDTMSAVQKFQSPIVANGRIFVAADNQVFAFAVN